MGRLFRDRSGAPLSNMTTIIGPSGTGKSTMADAFGFIADCLEMGVEAAFDSKNRGGYEKIVSQGVHEPIRFELYYRETSNSRPITYELTISLDKNGRPFVAEREITPASKNNGASPFFSAFAKWKWVCF